MLIDKTRKTGKERSVELAGILKRTAEFLGVSIEEVSSIIERCPKLVDAIIGVESLKDILPQYVMLLNEAEPVVALIPPDTSCLEEKFFNMAVLAETAQEIRRAFLTSIVDSNAQVLAAFKAMQILDTRPRSPKS